MEEKGRKGSGEGQKEETSTHYVSSLFIPDWGGGLGIRLQRLCANDLAGKKTLLL